MATKHDTLLVSAELVKSNKIRASLTNQVNSQRLAMTSATDAENYVSNSPFQGYTHPDERCLRSYKGIFLGIFKSCDCDGLIAFAVQTTIR